MGPGLAANLAVTRSYISRHRRLLYGVTLKYGLSFVAKGAAEWRAPLNRFKVATSDPGIFMCRKGGTEA
jgi:hypothetical protein